MDTYYNDYNISLSDFPGGLPDELMDTLKPKKHRREVLVEDCYILSLSDLGKGLLRPVNQKVDEYLPLDVDIKQEGKQGETVLISRRGKLPLQYWIDLEEPIMVNISCHYRNSMLNQAIELDIASISYGIRPFLLCPCGYRANKLYLSPRQYSFLCRRCAGLYYESTTINKNSSVGGLGYLVFRHFKLDERKAKVKRIFYAGKYTRKAKRVMSHIAKYSAVAAVQKVKTGELHP